MDESQQRAAVAAEARSWLGTPYHHLGDIKGAGVDCAMLLVRVYCDLGMLPPFDPRPYSPQWHLHNDRELYLEWLQQHGHEVNRAGTGDVVVWKFGRTFSHGAIVVDEEGTIVHALAREGRVLLGNMRDPSFAGPKRAPRPVRYFSAWSAV